MTHAKEPQMEPQKFQYMNAKPGDVVRCVGWQCNASWCDGKDYVVQSNGFIIDGAGDHRYLTSARFIFTSRASDAPLTLKAMTPEQAGPIMEAFRQGGALQKWIGGQEWMTMAPGSRIKPDRAYRLPPKPVATMNWTGIHPDITHVAMDMDGSIWLCRWKPSILGDGWNNACMWRIDNLLSPCPFQANGADWKDTLIARPKEGGE